MIDVNACYKIAFDSWVEKISFEQMAERVRDYTKASVLIVKTDGEIPIYASAMSGKKFQKVRKKWLTTQVYDYFIKKKIDFSGEFYCFSNHITVVAKEIKIDGLLYGYATVVFRDGYPEAKEEYLAVADILSTISINYWRENSYPLKGNVLMRKRLVIHDIFCGTACDLRYLSREIQGNYVVVYFPKNTIRNFFHVVSGVWEQNYIWEEQETLWALFYHMDSSKEENLLLQKLKQLQVPCCVSTPFQDLTKCKKKVKWLRRMDLLKEYDKADNVMLEGEWYAETMYTYAYPMLASMGVNDYSLRILEREDEEKNTEFYDTLKTYFLCGHNAVETANILHIHRNTLIYRLKKIRELTGMDIEDVKKSEELLALMMMNDFTHLDGGMDI